MSREDRGTGYEAECIDAAGAECPRAFSKPFVKGLRKAGGEGETNGPGDVCAGTVGARYRRDLAVYYVLHPESQDRM
jgi:hypothetical protein